MYRSDYQEKIGIGSQNSRIKNFEVMKKHFKSYLTGFEGAKELRIKLMETQNASEVRDLVEEFLEKCQIDNH